MNTFGVVTRDGDQQTDTPSVRVNETFFNSLKKPLTMGVANLASHSLFPQKARGVLSPDLGLKTIAPVLKGKRRKPGRLAPARDNADVAQW